MQITIDSNKCDGSNTFYETVFSALNVSGYDGWSQRVNFNCSADILKEFLLNVYKEGNVEFVMENFVFDSIVNPVTQDDYQWQSIFKVLDNIMGDDSPYELTIVNGLIRLVIDKNKCESYKTFYETIYRQLDGKDYIDWEQYDNLCYSADMLNEFLWYVNCIVNTEFVMANFDIDRMKEPKTYDDYEWQLIFKILRDFVKDYPNNKLTVSSNAS